MLFYDPYFQYLIGKFFQHEFRMSDPTELFASDCEKLELLLPRA